MRKSKASRPLPRLPRGRQLGNRSIVTPGAPLAPDLATIIDRVMTALAERIRTHGRSSHVA